MSRIEIPETPTEIVEDKNRRNLEDYRRRQQLARWANEERAVKRQLSLDVEDLDS